MPPPDGCVRGLKVLRGSLEALFGAGSANDFFSLAEAKSRLLVTKRFPEIVELCVDLLDLRRHRGIESRRETVPEILSLLRELLDLDVDVVGGHVGLKRDVDYVHSREVSGRNLTADRLSVATLATNLLVHD